MLGASLLITIFTQAMSTLFAHRGSNLRWGLKTLLQTIDPGLGRQADQLAQAILTEPILSDSIFSRFKNVFLIGWLTRRWRLASALRVEELLRIVPKIAQNRVVLPPIQPASAGSGGDAPPNHPPQPPPTAAAQAAAQLFQTADPVATQALQHLFNELQELMPAQTDQARALIHEMSNQAQASAAAVAQEVESWFNSAMDRVSQRFVMQMRIWTIVFSIILSFATHLDSFRLFTQLSSDAEMREKLVSSADTMSKQAASILPTGSAGNASVSIVPGIYSSKIRELVSQQPALASALGSPPSFNSREEGAAWIEEQLKDDTSAKQVVAQYEQLIDNGLKDNADKLLDQSKSVKNILGNAGYQLIPSPYPRPWYRFTSREFWGTLASAGFLSLGAPFWFNALKTLSSLRPVVATKEQNEKEQKQKDRSALDGHPH